MSGFHYTQSRSVKVKIGYLGTQKNNLCRIYAESHKTALVTCMCSVIKVTFIFILTF